MLLPDGVEVPHGVTESNRSLIMCNSARIECCLVYHSVWPADYGILGYQSNGRRAFKGLDSK